MDLNVKTYQPVYIVYILFISYKVHVKALHCSTTVINVISVRAGQTTMQNINNYDWDCHIHTTL